MERRNKKNKVNGIDQKTRKEMNRNIRNENKNFRQMLFYHLSDNNLVISKVLMKFMEIMSQSSPYMTSLIKKLSPPLGTFQLYKLCSVTFSFKILHLFLVYFLLLLVHWKSMSRKISASKNLMEISKRIRAVLSVLP